ncbi:amidohydrolase, imidazolonepropionase [Desulfosporosinus acidiphilus SJ4]|uniref:Amidohydrolase, imidazolonepropionase n=1 Tax=Desulfosporosinus acidiphilus (strain DSM 22704 / JCM 16185 / SJ4) TaxID=646529 RepID=I4D206_DESAJ|nr:amidohydrolase [Desulfosporosinus acidiphilus]AFM39830.1 amidohydrolase, imidazolonepropionase [Desulfosporosinus acidiphilus SJ4]
MRKLLIKNGRIYTMAGPDFSGDILIEGSKIAALGEVLDVPEDAEVIDASGCLVLPGMIDAHCHVGIGEEIYRWEGEDFNEMTDPVTPDMRAIDGINPEDEGFRDARLGGVTAVFTGPGSGNVIGGTGVVMKTAGKIVDKMVVRDPAGLKIAFGENPKMVYGEQKKMPMTRMGTAALLRQALVDAQVYRDKLEDGKKDPDKLPERDLGLETLLKVIRKEIPLRAHAHRADDIMTAIRIAREFDVDLVIEHCTEGHKIAEELAELGYPAVVGPLLTNRSKVELKDKSFKTPGVLAKAGVKVAIMTDHSVTPIEQLPLCAAFAHKAGMDKEDALRAITINAAEILGVSDRIGSLEVGKDADLVVWSEHPFQLAARPLYVIIDGKLVCPEAKRAEANDGL